MKRKILDPIWGNDEKTQILCRFELENGSIHEVSVVNTLEGNPDWVEILNTFTIEEIDNNTEKEIEFQQNQMAEEEQFRANQESEFIFEEKVKLFDSEPIQNSTQTKLKKKLRQSDSLALATAYAAAIIVLDELEQKDNL